MDSEKGDRSRFENDVKVEATKLHYSELVSGRRFENDVKVEATKLLLRLEIRDLRLRMM